MDAQLTAIIDVASGCVHRAKVVELLKSGEVRVQLDGDPPTRIACDVLQTGSEPGLVLEVGSPVLVLTPATADESGCVLGGLGPYLPPKQHTGPPAEVTLEASQNLTFKCGDSSMTLGRDGKILIKGVDIVTRASRTQKIKAGTVHIN